MLAMFKYRKIFLVVKKKKMFDVDVNIFYDGQGWSSDVLNSLTQSKIYEPIKKFKITFLMQESK